MDSDNIMTSVKFHVGKMIYIIIRYVLEARDQRMLQLWLNRKLETLHKYNQFWRCKINVSNSRTDVTYKNWCNVQFVSFYIQFYPTKVGKQVYTWINKRDVMIIGYR